MKRSGVFRPPAELVAAIRAGDRTAEEELVLRYRRGVSIVVGQSLGGRAEAEDLCQEILQLALEKTRVGEIREPEKLAGFVSSLARHLVSQWWRREKRRQTEPGLDTADAANPERAEAPWARCPPASPLGHLLRDEAARGVRRVLSELRTERDRQILVRHYLSEDDKEAICADLGLTEDHFYRVLHRARRRFRELYEKTLAAGRRSGAERSLEK